MIPNKIWIDHEHETDWDVWQSHPVGTPYYHIPQSVIDQARDDLITGETPGLSRLLDIIEGEA